MYVAQDHPYSIPRPKGGGRSAMLAIAMHVLLALFLIVGLRWQSHAPDVVQAQLWSALPQQAAPPQPLQVNPITPLTKATTPTPLAQMEPTPQIKPDIVVKEETKKPPKKVETPPPVVPKVEPKPQPKPETKPPTPVHPSDRDYIDQMLASTGTAGKAQQTSGPSGTDSYIAALRAAIRPNINFPQSNLTATVKITQLPSGDVTDVAIVNSSGNAAFDAAVVRGIRQSSPLPKGDHGRVDRELILDVNQH